MGSADLALLSDRLSAMMNNTMFHIKICGVTNVDDALTVVAAGADAIGLNFYRYSPRYVEFERARQIVDALPDDFVVVGLFVNSTVREVCDTFDRLELDLIQLHGDEPPEFLEELNPRPVMKAFRIGPDALGPVYEYLDRCGRLGCMPRMVLIEQRVEGKYGGTGKTADWDVVRQYPAVALEKGYPPLVLAGGLTPQNVARAVSTVRPAAVDTAGGVESSQGRKDSAAVEAFVREAKGGV